MIDHHTYQLLERHNACQVLAVYVNVDSLSKHASGNKTKRDSITCVTNKIPLTQTRRIWRHISHNCSYVQEEIGRELRLDGF